MGATLVVALGLMASCGGGAGGAGPSGAGQGLKLLSFEQSDVDSAALNAVLVFRFSEELSPGTVSPASIQIREGGDFGRSVPGEYHVMGATVEFRPRLPGLCDRSDAGFKPDTTYRVQCVGFPEEFALRNTHGQSLDSTMTRTFRTRVDTDPRLFTDLLPGAGPQVLSCAPSNGTAAVAVAQGNKIVIEVNQNLDPCSVDTSTILFHQYEVGDPNAFLPAGNGRNTGFDSINDLSPSPYSWGAGNSTPVAPAQRIPAKIELVQDFESTQIVITPVFGEFPDNALLVVEMTTGVEDFGGQSATPFLAAFTTENRPAATGVFKLHYAGEVEIDDERTTADVDTARAPSRAQGFLLFSGDGDNGGDPLTPSLPQTPASLCTIDRQPNDGTKDDFDPLTDVLLDTGASLNSCPNVTDGSTAVVWEFQTFRIRSGITVRVIGANPAIILVQGDAQIETGGRLAARGDGTGGSPRSDGRQGNSTYGVPTGVPGGVGVAGGGDGGKSYAADNAVKKGDPGVDGFGSPDFGVQGGQGSGHGNVNATLLIHNTGPTLNSGSGGGGGNITKGGDGEANGTATATMLEGTPDGAGGKAYATAPGEKRLLAPIAGSGGGAAGAAYSSYTDERASGGSGGAGGGFIDLTAGGDILVFGTIDASGGRGGDGNLSPWGQEHQSSGGGGGGGGGVRLLTPGQINLSGGTVTAAGGQGGYGAVGTTYPGPRNNGGDGGNGRIVLEDGDSVIAGLGGATIEPSEGQEGFYRGVFDATRFQGGGLDPAATTSYFFIGPLNPTFSTPIQTYGVQTDFVAAVTREGSRGTGSTAMLLEVRGFPITPDGTPDLGSPTGWYTVGHFRDTGVDAQPSWHPAQQPIDGVVPPPDNVGTGIANVNGSGALEVRISFYLPAAMGATDPGPYIDLWNIRFAYDQ